MTPQGKSRWPGLLRSLFLGSLALAILFDQVVVAPTAQPILIFLVIFLFGCIPALRGDGNSNKPSPFARIIMALLGVSFPASFRENEEHPDGIGSSTDGPTHSHGASPAAQEPPSPKSSSASTKERK